MDCKMNQKLQLLIAEVVVKNREENRARLKKRFRFT